MNRATKAMMLGGALVALVPLTSLAQTGPGYGKRLYVANCAICHGVDGKGNGPYRPYLTKNPTDITVLARNNNGVFPVERVYQVIDGRWEVGAHGPREMPIWGYNYMFKPDEVNPESAFDMESTVRTRILALIEFIYRLQSR